MLQIEEDFYPRLFEASKKSNPDRLYNKGTGNVFLLKKLVEEFGDKYTFKTGKRIENRAKVSHEELMDDVQFVVDKYELDVTSISMMPPGKRDGGLSDKYYTLSFIIDGELAKAKFSGVSTGEQLKQTPTVFKEGLVCYFFSTEEVYEAFSKRSPKQKEEGYNSLINSMITDITKNGIQGIEEKDKTKILDLLEGEVEKMNLDILNSIFNAMSIGNALKTAADGRFIKEKWEIYRDDFFNRIKSEAAQSIGFSSKAVDK